jgi:tetratricopeptide (TPR) repeat protein
MMRFRIFLRPCLACLAILLAVAHAAAQDDGRESLRKEIASARELIFQGSYDEAIKRFGELSASRAESPAGDFYQAVALLWKSYVDATKLDAGSRHYDEAINTALASAIRKAEAMKARANGSKADEAEALYYLGSAFAIRSRVNLYQNHAVPAARYARTAQDHLNALIKLDPDYADAYFALGGIYYRAGVLFDSPVGRLATTVLGSKALPAGDVERGIDYLKTASSGSRFAGVDAKLGLLEIYVPRGEHLDEALALARELQTRYPGNQTFARYLMRVYLGLKDRAKLTLAARAVLARVKEGKPGFGVFMKAEADRFMLEARKLP